MGFRLERLGVGLLGLRLEGLWFRGLGMNGLRFGIGGSGFRVWGFLGSGLINPISPTSPINPLSPINPISPKKAPWAQGLGMEPTHLSSGAESAPVFRQGVQPKVCAARLGEQYKFT